MHDLVLEKRSYGENAIQHAHSFSQLILPMTGSLELQLKGESISLSRDKFCFLPSGFTHGFHADGANQFLVLDIPQSITKQTGKRMSDYRIDQAMDARWEAVRSLVLSEIENGGKGNLKALLSYIWSMMEMEKELASVSYMKENLSRSITVKELATIENYNPSYFSEWFRKRTGQTPLVFLQRLRLEKAKELLERTNDSLLQIALAVGYEQQSSLTRLFMRFEGCSPRAYRVMSRNSDKKS